MSEVNLTQREAYTVAEVALKLAVSRQNVQHHIRSGAIKAVRFGRQWRITKAEFERIMLYGVPHSRNQEVSNA